MMDIVGNLYEVEGFSKVVQASRALTNYWPGRTQQTTRPPQYSACWTRTMTASSMRRSLSAGVSVTRGFALSSTAALIVNSTLCQILYYLPIYSTNSTSNTKSNFLSYRRRSLNISQSATFTMASNSQELVNSFVVFCTLYFDYSLHKLRLESGDEFSEDVGGSSLCTLPW